MSKKQSKNKGLYQRDGVWYLDIRAGNQRIRRSTGTSDKAKAQAYRVQLEHEIWQQQHLGVLPKHLWDEAATKWIKEKQDKKSIEDDICRIWQLTALRGRYLQDLDRKTIMKVVSELPCSNSTKNRYLALIRSILNKCVNEWDWLSKAPKLTLYKEPKKRIRWLKPQEAQKLVHAFENLPYMQHMIIFSLVTGLRQNNVLNLKWEQIDLKRRIAWIYPDETKNSQALGVPLNQVALQVLAVRQKTTPFVFNNSKGQPVKAVSHRIWRKGLKEAGISNFKWHDLRHTWASWLVQSGVPLLALKEMGGWESLEMVQKYAHLSSQHLQDHADNLLLNWDTIWTQSKKSDNSGTKEKSLNNCLGL